MDKVSYKELTIGFLVVMVFFLSVAVGIVSHQADSLEVRMNYIENPNQE